MTEDEKRELIERAHQLNELTRHPGWEILSDLVYFGPGGSSTHQRKIVTGSANWDEYQRDVGFIRGIHHVIEAPDRLETMVRNAQVGEEE